MGRRRSGGLEVQSAGGFRGPFRHEDAFPGRRGRPGPGPAGRSTGLPRLLVAGRPSGRLPARGPWARPRGGRGGGSFPTASIAERRSFSISSQLSRRHWPGRRFPRVRSPTAILLSCCTLWPRAASIRRISRFRPSSRTISRTVLCLCCERTVTRLAWTVASDKATPCRRLSMVSGVGTPATWTR